MNYYSALRRSGKVLDAYFEQSKDVLHNASKGHIREVILNKVIRPFLPPCYGLSGGEAFDSTGVVSRQLDLVVYDALYSYTIPYAEGFIQFPCESVYGNIEIKSMLDKEEFENAIKNIASLKSLKRESTHSWTVTPQVQISINGLPGDFGRNKYFGIIFAYNSVSVESVMQYLHILGAIPAAYRPNAIVLYDKKTIIFQAVDEQLQAYQSDDFNKYIALDCGEDVLAVFIGLLINYTRYTLLKVADIPVLTNTVLQDILDHNIKEKKSRYIEYIKSKWVEKDGVRVELSEKELAEYHEMIYRALYG